LADCAGRGGDCFPSCKRAIAALGGPGDGRGPTGLKVAAVVWNGLGIEDGVASAGVSIAGLGSGDGAALWTSAFVFPTHVP
tara:strand:- start:75 stop:317 length:243 start_codon:yes stop_codon:yes gene_type:complete